MSQALYCHPYCKQSTSNFLILILLLYFLILCYPWSTVFKDTGSVLRIHSWKAWETDHIDGGRDQTRSVSTEVNTLPVITVVLQILSIRISTGMREGTTEVNNIPCFPSFPHITSLLMGLRGNRRLQIWNPVQSRAIQVPTHCIFSLQSHLSSFQ